MTYNYKKLVAGYQLKADPVDVHFLYWILLYNYLEPVGTTENYSALN